MLMLASGSIARQGSYGMVIKAALTSDNKSAGYLGLFFFFLPQPNHMSTIKRSHVEAILDRLASSVNCYNNGIQGLQGGVELGGREGVGESNSCIGGFEVAK